MSICWNPVKTTCLLLFVCNQYVECCGYHKGDTLGSITSIFQKSSLDVASIFVNHWTDMKGCTIRWLKRFKVKIVRLGCYQLCLICVLRRYLPPPHFQASSVYVYVRGLWAIATNFIWLSEINVSTSSLYTPGRWKSKTHMVAKFRLQAIVWCH